MKENFFWIILFAWWMVANNDWDFKVDTDTIKVEAQSPTKSKDIDDGPKSDF